MFMLAGPKSSWTYSGCLPAMRSIVAQVWRRSWNLMDGRSAATHEGWPLGRDRHLPQKLTLGPVRRQWSCYAFCIYLGCMLACGRYCGVSVPALAQSAAGFVLWWVACTLHDGTLCVGQTFQERRGFRGRVVLCEFGLQLARPLAVARLG